MLSPFRVILAVIVGYDVAVGLLGYRVARCLVCLVSRTINAQPIADIAEDINDFILRRMCVQINDDALHGSASRLCDALDLPYSLRIAHPQGRVYWYCIDYVKVRAWKGLFFGLNTGLRAHH